MILHKSFKHGWFYHYRVHEQKLLHANPLLQEYLKGLFEHCPEEKFTTGPRSSALKFPMEHDALAASGHEVCTLASNAGNRYKTAHSNVEVSMLEEDTKTIAVEVPLWLDRGEHLIMDAFDGPLSGHIDILRWENDKIWVWDYKPKAAKEKYAATQTYAYAVMLATRTGIPLKEFRCGWFDEEDAYVFAPHSIKSSNVRPKERARSNVTT